MKLILSIWFSLYALLACGIFSIVSCQTMRLPNNPPAATPQYQFPNVLEEQPKIAISAMEELEQMVENEVNEQAIRIAKH